jgi:serine/threonine-protein kinase HipA
LRSFQVSLGSIVVGHLAEADRGRVSFRLIDDYRNLVHRPILSQSFEDDLAKVYRGKPNELPPFFANLVPEGALRNLIESSLAIPHGDEMALLEAVGRDLPGAVEVALEEGSDLLEVSEEGAGESANGLSEVDDEEPALRFSLAGVQLKFSVLREAEKLTLPAHGQRGEWIVKLDSSRFPQVAENEFAVLEWARASGFEVPECHLQPASSLSQALRPYAIPGTSVLVIRRYDREGSRRIHQEDFAQVVNLPPRLRYDLISYEQCAGLVRTIVGEDAYFEFIRRLVFVVASGNTDAHLKNWSLVYPDSVNAELSPLYDQVCTIAWEEMPRTLALKLAGRKSLLQIEEATFSRLAEKAGGDIGRTLSTVSEALQRIAESWRNSDIQRLMPPGHVAALRDYWERAPLLKRHSDWLH